MLKLWHMRLRCPRPGDGSFFEGVFHPLLYALHLLHKGAQLHHAQVGKLFLFLERRFHLQQFVAIVEHTPEIVNLLGQASCVVVRCDRRQRAVFDVVIRMFVSESGAFRADVRR